MFQSYRARLAAAAAALSVHDVADAARQLDAAPETLRGWEWRHLQGRLDDSSSVVPLPAGGSGLLVPGADRLRVGFVGRDGLRLTNLEGGEGLYLPLHPFGPRAAQVAETRLGLRIAICPMLETLDLYDGAGRRLCRADQQGGQEPRAALSPDGARFASPWRQGEWVRLAIFDARSGGRTAVCEGHRENIWSFAFSPDGTRLATSGEDRSARLWDPATGELLGTFKGHENKVLSVSFSPDGSRLLTA